MFKFKNQEFTFDVDMSNLPCGLDGAIYLVEMATDGSMYEYTGNKAGARYGTGYCDTYVLMLSSLLTARYSTRLSSLNFY